MWWDGEEGFVLSSANRCVNPGVEASGSGPLRRCHQSHSYTTKVKHDKSQRIRITHPFHPKSGHEYTVRYVYPVLGRMFVCYENGHGRGIAIRVQWTSLVAPDPFVVFAQGRSLFRPKDLLDLVGVVKSLRGHRSGKRPKERDRDV